MVTVDSFHIERTTGGLWVWQKQAGWLAGGLVNWVAGWTRQTGRGIDRANRQTCSITKSQKTTSDKKKHVQRDDPAGTGDQCTVDTLSGNQLIMTRWTWLLKAKQAWIIAKGRPDWADRVARGVDQEIEKHTQPVRKKYKQRQYTSTLNKTDRQNCHSRLHSDFTFKSNRGKRSVR